MEKFDWSDREIIAVPAQEAIAVYVNQNGAVVIRFRDENAPDDCWAVIQPENVDRLCEALQEAKFQALDGRPPSLLIAPARPEDGAA